MSKVTELAAIAKVFANPQYEEWNEIEAAEKIRTAFLNDWKGALKEPPPVLRVGLAFKFPAISGAYHVAYMNEDHAWCTTNGSRYGYLAPIGWDGWQYIARSSARTGGPGQNKDGWKVGDVLSYYQDKHRFIVRQTAEGCVLLEGVNGALFAEPNDTLKSFRRIGHYDQ